VVIIANIVKSSLLTFTHAGVRGGREALIFTAKDAKDAKGSKHISQSLYDIKNRLARSLLNSLIYFLTTFAFLRVLRGKNYRFYNPLRRLGGGWGLAMQIVATKPHPHPNPPLEGEGASVILGYIARPPKRSNLAE
jgi:hypothetical protein